MVNVIQQHHTELVRLCEKYCVRKLEVFGSASKCEGFDSQTSDLDFLVEYQPLEPDS